MSEEYAIVDCAGHKSDGDYLVVSGPDDENQYVDAKGRLWPRESLIFVDFVPPSGDLKKARDGSKARLDKVPLELLYGVARVLDYGDRKYEPGNWRKAAADGRQAVSDYVAACLRHLSEVQNGAHRVDEESGLPHLDHAITSLLIARYVAQNADLLEQDPGRGAEPS